MDVFATNVISSLGGAARVSELSKSPRTTVESWKSIGLSAARLDHLQRIAQQEGIAIDWSTGLLETGDGCSADHDAADTIGAKALSAGNGTENSPRVSANA
jgi:hypothetical protein